MSKKNLVEETVASVKQAKAEKAAPAPAPAPKARKRAKPAVAEHCFGLLFGKSLKIKKTFATLTEALDYVKALPLTRAVDARLATIQKLAVETRIAIQSLPSTPEPSPEEDAPTAWIEPLSAYAKKTGRVSSAAVEEPAPAEDEDEDEDEDDLDSEPEEAE